MRIAIVACLVVLGCGSVSKAPSDAGSDSESAGGVGGVGGSGLSGSAGHGVGGDSGAAGKDGGAGGRPLGAGCTDDSQCTSAVCAKAMSTDTSGICCAGRPDACNTCVGGYLTPVQDGTSADLCLQCESGRTAPVTDGTPCGTAGPSSPRPPSCNGLVGSDYRCASGTCELQTGSVNCSTFACAPNCSNPMPGCFTYNFDNVQQTTALCLCVAGSGLCN